MLAIPEYSVDRGREREREIEIEAIEYNFYFGECTFVYAALGINDKERLNNSYRVERCNKICTLYF